MTRRKSNFFPSQKYEWVPSWKTLPKSLYCYYSPTVHYFILAWTIYKSIFYGISCPASPSLKCHSTHVVLRALSSVHSCNWELTLDCLQVEVAYLYKVRTMLYILGILYLVRILPLELQTKVNGNLHSSLAKVLLEHFFKEINFWWLHHMSHWM